VYGQVVGTVNVKDAKQTSVKMDIPAGIYSVEAVTANSKYTQMLIVR
jgi:protein involved in sex pheromone biosynthesis